MGGNSHQIPPKFKKKFSTCYAFLRAWYFARIWHFNFQFCQLPGGKQFFWKVSLTDFDSNINVSYFLGAILNFFKFKIFFESCQLLCQSVTLQNCQKIGKICQKFWQNTRHAEMHSKWKNFFKILAGCTFTSRSFQTVSRPNTYLFSNF